MHVVHHGSDFYGSDFGGAKVVVITIAGMLLRYRRIHQRLLRPTVDVQVVTILYIPYISPCPGMVSEI
jgi:hypothetical protein